jgi:hypothetical protein
MAPVRHPKKEVELALSFAREHGWTVETSARAHRWGVAKCGHGCIESVWSTPKNAGNHAKKIRRAVEKCPHQYPDEDEENQ